MAIARTGVYVDDYLECEILLDSIFFSLRSRVPVDLLILLASFCSADSSTLAGDLQRILSTMHELDERADGDDFATIFFLWKNHFVESAKKQSLRE